MAATFHGLPGKLQSRLNVFAAKPRESGFYLDESVPRFQKFKDIGDHDTAPFKAWLAVADRRINGYVIRPIESFCLHMPRIYYITSRPLGCRPIPQGSAEFLQAALAVASSTPHQSTGPMQLPVLRVLSASSRRVSKKA